MFPPSVTVSNASDTQVLCFENQLRSSLHYSLFCLRTAQRNEAVSKQLRPCKHKSFVKNYQYMMAWVDYSIAEQHLTPSNRKYDWYAGCFTRATLRGKHTSEFCLRCAGRQMQLRRKSFHSSALRAETDNISTLQYHWSLQNSWQSTEIVCFQRPIQSAQWNELTVRSSCSQ